MRGRGRQADRSYSGTMAAAIIAVLAVTLLFVSVLYKRTGRGAAGTELAQLSYARTVRLASEVEATLSAQGDMGSGTQALLSKAASELDATVVLFLEADTPLAVAHGPSLRAALGRIKDADASGTFTDSGQQPWVPRFGDPLDKDRFPRVHGRPVRVQASYPFAVEAPVGRNMTLRQIPLSIRSYGDGGFMSSLVVLFIVMSLVTVFVVLRLTRPLESTALAFERMASGNLRASMPATGIRELSWIARAAHRVSERVQESEEQQKDMLSRVGALLVEPVTRARKGLDELDRAAIPPAARQGLEAVDADVGELHRTVTALWGWHELEQGEVEATKADVDLRPMLNEVIDLYIARRAPDLVVELEIDDDVDETLHMDARLVASVLVSLLENARTHGKPPVKIQVKRSHTKVEFTVRDEGEGVPFEQLGAIFEPFRRATKEGAEPAATGLGLGLRVARLALGVHGGGLTARNLPNAGFEVSFWLPAPPIRVSAIDKSLLQSVDWAHHGADALDMPLKKDAAEAKPAKPETPKPEPSPEPETTPEAESEAAPAPATPEPEPEEDLYEPF